MPEAVMPDFVGKQGQKLILFEAGNVSFYEDDGERVVSTYLAFPRRIHTYYRPLIFFIFWTSSFSLKLL